MFQQVWSSAAPIATFLVGFFIEPIKSQIFQPRLRLRFGNGADLRGITLHENGGYLYLRGAISNHSRFFSAKAVRIFLARIERQKDDSTERIDYADALQFRWSAVPEASREAPREIPRGIEVCFDLLHSGEGQTGMRLCTTQSPRRYHSLFDDPGRYAITLAITADNARTRYSKLTLDWASDWQSVTLVG